jgi:hypothetical protein
MVIATYSAIPDDRTSWQLEASNIEPETVQLKYGRRINKTNYIGLDRRSYTKLKQQRAVK